MRARFRDQPRGPRTSHTGQASWLTCRFQRLWNKSRCEDFPMRRATLLCALCFTGVTLPFLACSASHNTGSGFTPMTNEDSGAKGLKDAMTTGDVTHPSPTSSGDSGGFSMPDFDSGLPDGSVIVTSTIYAHTDTSLYSL